MRRLSALVALFMVVSVMPPVSASTGPFEVSFSSVKLRSELVDFEVEVVDASGKPAAEKTEIESSTGSGWKSEGELTKDPRGTLAPLTVRMDSSAEATLRVAATDAT